MFEAKTLPQRDRQRVCVMQHSQQGFEDVCGTSLRHWEGRGLLHATTPFEDSGTCHPTSERGGCVMRCLSLGSQPLALSFPLRRLCHATSATLLPQDLPLYLSTLFRLYSCTFERFVVSPSLPYVHFRVFRGSPTSTRSWHP
jgi:hypothetical protein